MKKLLLTLTAVAGLTAASQAQDFGFGKGNTIVEGSLGFGTTDNKDTQRKSESFNFSPSVGYFVTDKIAVGVGVNVGTSKNTNYSVDPETFTKSNDFGASVYGRYYFLELGSRFKTYAQLTADYSTSSTETQVDDSKFTTNGFGVNGTVGANYFLTENIAIGYRFADVIGFNSSKADVDGAKASTSFSGNINNFNNFFNSGTFSLTFKF